MGYSSLWLASCDCAMTRASAESTLARLAGSTQERQAPLKALGQEPKNYVSRASHVKNGRNGIRLPIHEKND